MPSGCFDFVFSEHKANRETQHILSPVEYEAVRAETVLGICRCESFGDVV
jgi:hypothetical protein